VQYLHAIGRGVDHLAGIHGPRGYDLGHGVDLLQLEVADLILDQGPVFSAPLVEESAKGLALLILFFWKKDEFDDVIDGIVYAAMVGLGFAMGENILYYGRELLAGGIVGSLSLFVLRGMLAPFSHPLFTSMTGIGLGLAPQSNRG